MTSSQYQQKKKLAGKKNFNYAKYSIGGWCAKTVFFFLLTHFWILSDWQQNPNKIFLNVLLSVVVKLEKAAGWIRDNSLLVSFGWLGCKFPRPKTRFWCHKNCNSTIVIYLDCGICGTDLFPQLIPPLIVSNRNFPYRLLLDIFQWRLQLSLGLRNKSIQECNKINIIVKSFENKKRSGTATLWVNGSEKEVIQSSSEKFPEKTCNFERIIIEVAASGRLQSPDAEIFQFFPPIIEILKDNQPLKTPASFSHPHFLIDNVFRISVSEND